MLLFYDVAFSATLHYALAFYSLLVHQGKLYLDTSSILSHEAPPTVLTAPRRTNSEIKSVLL